MSLKPLLQSLMDTGFATEIRENESLFPWIESIHVLAISLVVGTISIVDLRLLGLASMDRAAGQLVRSIVKVTWGAFAVAALTGGLLFAANATTYAINFSFRVKLVLLALAGLNMAFFHVFSAGDLDKWGAGVAPPFRVRLAGTLSLLLWIGVISFGRWVGFTLK